jgi:prepilin-type N-terminal cleavage/methylation domain-containing protein/prepilin-type processing-associated H-X9-DG protein
MLRGRRKGFSLIELLVVIGVIAILVGLLLPALASARRQAAQVRCAASMKQLAGAFALYAHDNKGYYPVARWQIPPGAAAEPGIGNLYWSDFIAPYVARNARFNRWLVLNPAGLAAARRTVVWGCPNWDGIAAPVASGFNADGISAYENGYTMNPYPTYDVGHPAKAAQAVPASERALVVPSGGEDGQFFKQTKWTHPAERALLVESTLWLLGLNPVASPGDPVAPQRVQRGLSGVVGDMTIDRYRHGRLPRVLGDVYDPAGGRVAFNVAFADGHLETLRSAAAGYRAIRMRDP